MRTISVTNSFSDIKAKAYRDAKENKSRQGVCRANDVELTCQVIKKNGSNACREWNVYYYDQLGAPIDRNTALAIWEDFSRQRGWKTGANGVTLRWFGDQGWLAPPERDPFRGSIDQVCIVLKDGELVGNVPLPIVDVDTRNVTWVRYYDDLSYPVQFVEEYNSFGINVI